MKSIAAVAATSTARAVHRDRSTSTTAAQTATAFVSARITSLITSPGAPENAATDRATRPGRKGSFGAAAVAVLNGSSEVFAARGDSERAPRRAPARSCELADLVGDGASGGLE